MVGAAEVWLWGARTTRASVLWLTAASYSRLVNDLLASSHDFSALLSAMTQGQNFWRIQEEKVERHDGTFSRVSRLAKGGYKIFFSFIFLPLLPQIRVKNAATVDVS